MKPEVVKTKREAAADTASSSVAFGFKESASTQDDSLVMMTDDEIDGYAKAILPNSVFYVDVSVVALLLEDSESHLSSEIFPKFSEQATKKSLMFFANVDNHYILFAAQKNAENLVDKIICIDPAPSFEHKPSEQLLKILKDNFPGVEIVNSTTQMQPVKTHCGADESIKIVENNHCGKFCLFSAAALAFNLMSLDSSSSGEVKLICDCGDKEKFPFQDLDLSSSNKFADLIRKSFDEHRVKFDSKSVVDYELGLQCLMRDFKEKILPQLSQNTSSACASKPASAATAAFKPVLHFNPPRLSELSCHTFNPFTAPVMGLDLLADAAVFPAEVEEYSGLTAVDDKKRSRVEERAAEVIDSNLEDFDDGLMPMQKEEEQSSDFFVPHSSSRLDGSAAIKKSRTS